MTTDQATLMTAAGGSMATQRACEPAHTQPEPRPTVPLGEDRRWAENWRANEVRWLHARVEDLERRLRRRTTALILALVFGGLAAVAAAAGGAAFSSGQGSGDVGVRAGLGAGTPQTEPARDQAAASGAQPDRALGSVWNARMADALHEANKGIEAEIEQIERRALGR